MRPLKSKKPGQKDVGEASKAGRGKRGKASKAGRGKSGMDKIEKRAEAHIALTIVGGRKKT